jgi:hypothetical protein
MTGAKRAAAPSVKGASGQTHWLDATDHLTEDGHRYEETVVRQRLRRDQVTPPAVAILRISELRKHLESASSCGRIQ